MTQKYQKRYKDADFQADFESIEKIVKNTPIKFYKQNKFDENE
jgi:hypothetical protein